MDFQLVNGCEAGEGKLTGASPNPLLDEFQERLSKCSLTSLSGRSNKDWPLLSCDLLQSTCSQIRQNQLLPSSDLNSAIGRPFQSTL